MTNFLFVSFILTPPSFVHVFVWLPYTRLFYFISIGERVLAVTFFIKTFLSFFYKNVNKNKKRVYISVNFIIWFEVFSDKECTAWYRYYRWCWFMSLCSAFGIVLFQDLRIFFSGNKSDYHFFCLILKYYKLLVTFSSSFDIAFVLSIWLFFTRLISIVHNCS